LTFQAVGPGWGIRIFEVSHEDICAGVQRIDNHLSFWRTSDLDSSIQQIIWDWSDGPLGLSDVMCLSWEAGQLARIEFELTLVALEKQIGSCGFESTVKTAEELDCFRGEHFGFRGVTGSATLEDGQGRTHGMNPL
jgi:hypothetical protein